MKRLTPLPPHEQPATASLMEACKQGFWQCKLCRHIGEPDYIPDPYDLAAPQRRCTKCGHHFVKWNDPVF